MSMPDNNLDITIPACRQYTELRHVFSSLADRLGYKARFLLPASDDQVFILQHDQKRITIPFQAKRAEQAGVAFTPDSVKLWASAEKVTADRIADNDISLNCDIITPIAYLLTLCEEFTDPHRDIYGLVEGRRSKRFASRSLMTPFFDNLTIFLAGLLRIDVVGGRPSLSIAVTCDVDYVNDDHFPAVLKFLADYRVHRPTFYLYGGAENKKTKYDPPYNIEDSEVAARLEILKHCEVEIGLHSGFLAHDRLDLLLEQKDRVEQWLGKPIYGHRCHYFRFAFPRSWKRQQQAGFVYDSSLGYPDVYGIRNGCASPITMDADSSFYILPVMVLDQHFFWPEVVAEKQWQQIIAGMLDEIEAVNGMLVLDWHSYTLHTHGFEGWWKPLAYLLDEALKRNAYLAGAKEVLKTLINNHQSAPFFPEILGNSAKIKKMRR